jgi:hypothetical protein
MSDLFIWIYSGGGGLEFHETLRGGGARYKSSGTFQFSNGMPAVSRVGHVDSRKHFTLTKEIGMQSD